MERAIYMLPHADETEVERKLDSFTKSMREYLDAGG